MKSPDRLWVIKKHKFWYIAFDSEAKATDAVEDSHRQGLKNVEFIGEYILAPTEEEKKERDRWTKK